MTAAGNAGLERGWRRMVAERPNQAEGHRQYGRLLVRRFMLTEARASLARALWLDGRHAETALAAAQLDFADERLAACRSILTFALAYRPEIAALHANLAVVLDRLRLPGGGRHLRQALALEPALTAAHAAAGGREGIADGRALRRTLSLDPRHAGALVNLGNRLKDGDRVEAALTCYRKALAIEPGRPESWFNWASANHAAGEIDGAIAGYRRAIARDPRHAWRLRLATLLPPMPRSLADIQTWRDRFAREVAALAAADLRVTDPVADCHWTNFYLAYHDLDDRLLQEAASRLMTLSCPTISAAPTLRRRAGKRRLALVSAYFREHTIGHLFRGVVEAIDRDRFAVAVVQVGPADDRMSRSLANAADEHVVLPLDLADAQRLLAERQLDAVLYTDIGMDPATYYLAHARLAGLQMATWGHPVTTGIASVDWFVSAEGYDAPAAERHYSERLVRLSELLLCYRPISIAWTPADRLRLGFESGRRAYFCAQSLFKIHPRFDRMLTDILARDSDAVLYFIEGHRRPWCDLLRRRLGVHRRDAAARMRFLPRLSADDFVRAMAVADVVLDTPGFSGGKTSLECLSTGTPVVTLPSRFLRGRLTYGFYERLGIRDAVAASDFEYVDLAVGLATDAERRRSLGARIVAAMPRLYGTVAPVREFERLVFEATA